MPTSDRMSDSGSSANAVGGISLFISIAGMIYAAINHKKIRGQCCGRELSASIDIESTTKEDEKKEAEPEDATPKPRRSSVSSVKSNDSTITIHPIKKYNRNES